jgi:hypothetical protein
VRGLVFSRSSAVVESFGKLRMSVGTHAGPRRLGAALYHFGVTTVASLKPHSEHL